MYLALIVEDDEDAASITAAHLTHAGYEVQTARTCLRAERLLEVQDFDLILLDEILPDRRGDTLCRAIRERSSCPIIFMSCLDSSDASISTLRRGRDEHMVKPVNYTELLARAEALIRREGRHRRSVDRNLRDFQHFSMDTTRRRVRRDGVEIDLSAIEYALLFYLVEHPDSLLLYQELYQNVWFTDSLGDVRTVMVHISNLRKKIDPNKSGLITTVRNAGYIFSDI